MKCQDLLSGKNKKNILNMSPAKLAKSVEKINETLICTVEIESEKVTLEAQLAFFINVQRAVIGPSATLMGRPRLAIDLCRMLTGG